jgi:DNA polymerase-4
MISAKIIFHIDLNCFFASCERAENPELEGKPIAVAHLDPLRRGIILSPSYEARKFGIHTTMLVREALLLCNELIVIEPKMRLYQEYSKKFFEYLRTVTPLIEAASIDEGYLDVTDVCKKIYPLTLAEQMQKKILEIGLPCSIGIGPNRFLAKMASDFKKPLGITVFRKREIDQYLWPQPIENMYGVGKKTAPKLREIGIETIGDLANYANFELLKATVGEVYGMSLIQRANGIDTSELVVEETEQSSVSCAHTFDNPVFDARLLKDTLRVLANTISHRLESANQVAQTIGITLKYPDLRQISRGRSVKKATNDAKEIYQLAEDVFDDFFQEGDQIRLVGIFANRLLRAQEQVKQVTIFDDLSALEKEEGIQKLLKSVKKEFGDTSINRGYYKYKKKEE